jgi:hypothetical protein
MTNLELRQLLRNQLVIMEALERLLFSSGIASGRGLLNEKDGQALLKIADAQGATTATIEDIGR